MKTTISMGREIKGFLLALCVIFFSNTLISQENNEVCATIDDASSDPLGIYSYDTSPSYFSSCDPIVLNIYFWGINRPDGTNDYPNRANDVLQGIANLNILYNEFGIYFKYRGFEEIDSPALPGDPNGYYVLDGGSQGSAIAQFNALTAWAAANGYRKDDAFNVYAFGWATGFGGIATGRTISGVKSSGLTTFHLTHEIGHNLTLRHTRSSSENVTRDPEDACFNADSAGDRVVDTAANPGFSQGGTYPYVNLSTCEYIENTVEKDNCGTGVPYEISNEDLINMMADSAPCMQVYITTGQGIRAREALVNDPNNYYTATHTTIASLYEPYQGEYYVAGPYDPNLHTPLFQPGFNYRFVTCDCEADCPEPSPYEDVSFQYTNNSLLTISKYETDFGSITHPNGTAIQLDIEACDSNGQTTRRCYENYNKAPIGGTVTKFNDGVFNGNVTITPQDSTQINDPNLINNLQPGLYEIEKDYEDGPSKETVIVKEN